MRQFSPKVLIFGEYSVLEGSGALTVPYHKHSAYFDFPSPQDKSEAEISSRSLKELASYLEDRSEVFNSFFDLTRFRADTDRGMFLRSDIPQNYGLGSSGVVVAAAFDRFGTQEFIALDLDKKRDLLADAESLFHSRSSGIDPLAAYSGKPLHLSGSLIETVSEKQLFPVLERFGLLDTGRPSSTGNLVGLFRSWLEDQKFSRAFRKNYLPLVDGLVEGAISGEFTGFQSNMYDLSLFQFEYFRPMIPAELYQPWKDGLDSGNYLLKLCGSGGGGYLLVYAENLLESVRQTGLPVAGLV